MGVYSRRETVPWLAMLSCVSALCRSQSDSDQQPSYDDTEAYLVYSILIPRDWTVVNAKAESLVIACQTFSSEMCLKPEGESAKILDPVIANYKQLATKRWRLKREFTLSKPYTLVDQKQLDAFFANGASGWDRFYAQYPKSGGYLFLSPVGFNQAKDVAVVSVNHSCGGLCGGGSFSVLQKKDGVWKDLRWKGGSCAWAS